MAKKKVKSSRGGGTNGSSNNSPSVGKTMYNGAASFGRLMSYFRLIGGIVISIIFAAIGVVIYKKPELPNSAEATVIKLICGINNTCNQATIQYNVADNSQHTATISGSYSMGQKITIYYTPTDPNHVETSKTPKMLGIGLIGFAVFMLLWSIIYFYLVQNYTVLAAANGAGTGLGIAGTAVSSFFRNS